MNIITDDFFKFNDMKFNSDVSALIKCLQNDNAEVYKNWIAKEMNYNIEDEKVIEIYEFILSLREKLKELKDLEDKKLLLEIFSRLLLSRYSGKKQENTTIMLILEKLIYSFNNKKPIIFIFGFGGYKNNNSPSYPEVDYAELFHMKFVTNFIWPIIKNYKYGVEFEYESEEISIQFNNVPQETTDRYTETFKKLLKYFVEKVNKINNVKINYSYVIGRELYEADETLYKKMEEYRPMMEEKVKNLPLEEQKIWLRRAKTNFLLKGIIDYTNCSEEELKEIYFQNRVTNECFLAADYDLRINYWERPNAITIFGTWGKSPCASPTDCGIHLKSTRWSNTDFWSGTGIFKLDGDYRIKEELILSHNQYANSKENIKYIKSDNTELLKISDNFINFPYI